ncbi:hypothetical protein, partial [Levilactobacillus namurensis]
MLRALGTLGIWLVILGGGTMVWLGFKQPRSRTTILLGITLLGGGLIVKANPELFTRNSKIPIKHMIQV